jgi:hypothetical protein
MINKEARSNQKGNNNTNSITPFHHPVRSITIENKTGNNLKDLFLFCISVFLFAVSIQIILTLFSFVSDHEQTTMMKKECTTTYKMVIQILRFTEYTATYKMVM